MKNQYDHILEVYGKVKDVLPTLTANQYNFYKDDSMPVAKTIMNRTKNTWGEILDHLHCVLSVSTLGFKF